MIWHKTNIHQFKIIWLGIYLARCQFAAPSLHLLFFLPLPRQKKIECVYFPWNLGNFSSIVLHWTVIKNIKRCECQQADEFYTSSWKNSRTVYLSCIISKISQSVLRVLSWWTPCHIFFARLKKLEAHIGLCSRSARLPQATNFCPWVTGKKITFFI